MEEHLNSSRNSADDLVGHDCLGGDPIRPLSMAWITDDLLAETQEVWSEIYGRPIDESEAIEILINTKRFAEVLLQAARELQE